MAEWKEYTAKTVNEALTNAVVQLETTSDKLEYEIVEKETTGLLGLFSKPAKIRARVKYSLPDIATEFLNQVFQAMDITAEVEIELDEIENVMNIDMSGSEMGILIGKRGITLDSLQYLVSLVVNRNTENYVKIKLDTENYRERRRETLENLAHNLAHKVKRTHRPVSLEPMNPYERRVIHSALQKDKYVETHSEGDEPYRKVVITLKPGVDTGYERRDRYSYGNGRSYGRGNRGYRRKNDYYKKSYNDNYSKSEESTDAESVDNNVSEEE